MSWKKNVFSYLLWAFYTVMVGTCMAGIGNVFCGDDLPSYCGAVSAVILIAALGGAAFLLHRYAPGLKAYAHKRKKLRLAAEAGILTVLLVLGTIFRVAGLQDAEGTSLYYEAAEVKMGQDMPQIAHGAVHIYVWLLHLVFLFLGNRFALGIILQMAFQCIAALLLYYQIRKYIGLIAALTAAGFFTCAPYMVQGGLTLSPDMLYLCLLTAAWSIVAAVCGHGMGDGITGRKPAPFFYILAGIVSSVTAYLDVAGVLVLMFTVGMIFCVDRELSGLDRKKVPCLCCAFGFVFGFAGCAAVDSLASGKSFGSVLQVWFQLYTPEKFLLSATAGMRDSRMESLVLVGLMALGIYSFWFDKKRERLAMYMSASCAVIFAGCFGIFTSEMPGTLFLYLLFVIMAGIGLQQCFNGEEAPGTQTAQEEGVEQELQEQAKNKPDALGGKEPEEKEEKREIRYIENPLPLPKKHEKKVLDFDYPVADDDDFDI